MSNIRMWWERGLVTQGDLARLFHVTKRCIRFILRGEHWRKESIVKISKDQLERLAAEMRAELANKSGTGCVHETLDRFHLVLFGRGGNLRLHVGLEGTWPDQEMARPFAVAFGVPAEDLDAEGQTLPIATKSGRMLRLKTMRFSWQEELVVERPVVLAGRQLTFFGAAGALEAGL